jgi:hypothetical protein
MHKLPNSLRRMETGRHTSGGDIRGAVGVRGRIGNRTPARNREPQAPPPHAAVPVTPKQPRKPIIGMLCSISEQLYRKPVKVQGGRSQSVVEIR